MFCYMYMYYWYTTVYVEAMAVPAIFFPELAPEDIRYRYLKKKITTELNV